jgi:uncharacterized protein (DUF2164 family)
MWDNGWTTTIMSLYRLQKYVNGDGDPIDTSDAQSILNEVEKLKALYYNKGIDAAISVVDGCMDYENRMLGVRDTIVAGLENSKRS